MSGAIDFVDYALDEKAGIAAPQNLNITKFPSSSDGVYVVLMHWDYEKNRGEDYAGISWIFSQWGVLREKNSKEDFGIRVSRLKICIVSFESVSSFKSIKHIRSKKRIKMLLALKNVEYLQIPPRQKDIKKVAEKLSKQVIKNHKKQLETLGGFLDEDACLKQLFEYLHQLNSKENKDSVLQELKKEIDHICETLQDTDVYVALKDFQSTFEDPESEAFQDKYENLLQKVVQEGGF